jgi:hypothetical protein
MWQIYLENKINKVSITIKKLTNNLDLITSGLGAGYSARAANWTTLKYIFRLHSKNGSIVNNNLTDSLPEKL